MNLDKGLLSELKVSRYYVNKGYSIYLPASARGPVDMVVTRGSKILRIQVKTVYEDRDKLRVNIHHRKGGPKYTKEDVDMLVCVRYNCLWIIPMEDIENETTLIFGTLSGKPYKTGFKHEQYRAV